MFSHQYWILPLKLQLRRCPRGHGPGDLISRRRLAFIVIFAPGPVEAQVRVSFRLTHYRAAQAEQKLESRLAEVIIAPKIEHRG